MHVRRLFQPVELLRVLRAYYDQRKIAGYARLPQKRARRGFCGAAIRASGAQRGIDHQCGGAVDQPVRARIQRRASQRGAQNAVGESSGAVETAARFCARDARENVLRRIANQRKADLHPFAAAQRDRSAQRRAGVQHIARRIRKRFRDAARPRAGARAPDQRFQIGFVAARAHGIGDVRHLQMRLPIARAARKQNRMIIRRFGVYKQVGKRRVRRVIAFIAQRRIEAAGHGYAPVFLGFVFQRHALEDRSILRRYGDFQPRIDSRYALFEPRTARVKRDLILRAEHIIRVFIADMHVHSAARIAQIAEKPVQQQIAASGEHRAARADDRGYAAAVQDMRIHGIVFGGNARKILLAAGKGCSGDFAPAPRALRFALAQHQSQRARLRDIHKGFPDRAVAQRVAQRAQDHTLMVRHMAVHDRGYALRIGVQIIRRLHHAAAVEPAQIAHFDDVIRRRGGHAAQRQRRCIGRDDVLRAFAAER